MGKNRKTGVARFYPNVNFHLERKVIALKDTEERSEKVLIKPL